MRTSRSYALVLAGFWGVLFAAFTGGAGFAADVDCRITPLSSDSVSGKDTGKPFSLEREVDGDGVADVVRLQERRDTVGSSTTGKLTLSASEEVIEISRNISYSAMINIHIVPPALVDNDQTSARQLVEDALFGMICDVSDPSLSRLLDIEKPIVWHEGRPALPGNYAVYFAEAPVGLIPFIGAWSELGFGSKQPVAVWVEYLGANHMPTDVDKKANMHLLDGGFEMLDMTPLYRVLGTRHGVVAIDVSTNRYAWLYVFHGGQELRRKSIKSASFEGGEVTITTLIQELGVQQVGEIIVGLDDGRYTETWNTRMP